MFNPSTGQNTNPQSSTTQARSTRAVHPMSAVSLALLALVACAGSANAQDALGDGTALGTGTTLTTGTSQPGAVRSNSYQSNLVNQSQRSASYYQRPSFASELNFRNSIATGNAPGGLSFRGDLGYRAAGEFSGDLGSDALFAFRRDSLYSGLAGMGIRGTDALQYQFAMTTGSRPPSNLSGSLSVSRDNYYQNSSYTDNPYQNSAPGSFGSSRADNAPIGYDSNAVGTDFGGDSTMGTLRSSSAYSTTSDLSPSLMSVYGQGIDQKPIGMIASPLLGITSTPMAQEEAPANPLIARPGSTQENTRTENYQPTNRLTTSYDELVTQMKERVELLREESAMDAKSTIKVDESNTDWLTRQMQEIRDKLYGDKPASEDENNQNTDQQDPKNGSENDPTLTPTETGDQTTANPDSPVSKAIEDRMGGFNSDTTNADPYDYDPTRMAIDPETLEVLRGAAAQEVEQLFDPGAANRDIFGEHMVAGQRLIKNGRYFDAEERFTLALSIKPGDVASQLGRLHAQIGAGMVLSASTNLQSLFTRQPEIIASRYTGELLPSTERIESLIIRLKERAGITMPKYSERMLESESIQYSASVLLAYLGYQINDRTVILEGLEMADARGTQADRRFVSLLSQIWLIPSDESTAPTTTPSSADSD